MCNKHKRAPNVTMLLDIGYADYRMQPCTLSGMASYRHYKIRHYKMHVQTARTTLTIL